MLTQERHHEILEILRRRDAVSVAELAELLDTSESTVRRDLSVLDGQGKLKKVFGGATSILRAAGTAETDVMSREGVMTAEKERIARYAAALVNDDDYVFIDSGTTTSLLCDFLENDRASYVTNGIAHALKLMRRGFNVYLIGGFIKPVTEAAVGTEAVRALSRCNFTKAFMGTNGIDLAVGFTTPDREEAAVKETAVEHSYVSFVLADHSKFRRVTPVTFAAPEKCCIITDAAPPAEWSGRTAIKIVID